MQYNVDGIQVRFNLHLDPDPEPGGKKIKQ